MKKIVPLLLSLASLSSLCAQVVIVNPGIPNKETAIYREQIGKDLSVLEQHISHQIQDGHAWLEFRSLSQRADLLLRLDPENLFSYFSELTNKSKFNVIRRSNEVLENTTAAGKDELIISDFNALPIILRGFPWGARNFARISLLGTASSQEFSFELTVIGKESLKLLGKSWECWKVQIGLSGFWGGLVGKTTLWFDTQASHVLVRSEGPLAGPGSPSHILELKDYSATEN